MTKEAPIANDQFNRSVVRGLWSVAMRNRRQGEAHARPSAVRTLSLTPRFSGVIQNRVTGKTVSTVFAIRCTFTRREVCQTVKTVLIPDSRAVTPLKRGVNEIGPLRHGSLDTGHSLLINRGFR